MITALFLFLPASIIALRVGNDHLATSFEKLRESEENYQSLVENIPSVVLESNRHGETVFISQNILKIYGFSQKEIYEGRNFICFERFHIEEVDLVGTLFEMMFAGKQNSDIECRILSDNLFEFSAKCCIFIKNAINKDPDSRL